MLYSFSSGEIEARKRHILPKFISYLIGKTELKAQPSASSLPRVFYGIAVAQRHPRQLPPCAVASILQETCSSKRKLTSKSRVSVYNSGLHKAQITNINDISLA